MMAAWTEARKLNSIFASRSRVVCASQTAFSCPSQAIREGDAIVLSRLRQPLMLRHRQGGIMEMRPGPHICGLSSLTPALPQNSRCEGASPSHEGASTVRGVDVSARVTRDLDRPVSWVADTKGCRPIAVMSIGGSNHDAGGGKGIVAQIRKKVRGNVMPSSYYKNNPEKLRVIKLNKKPRYRDTHDWENYGLRLSLDTLCAAKTKAGAPCQNLPEPGATYCSKHARR